MLNQNVIYSCYREINDFYNCIDFGYIDSVKWFLDHVDHSQPVIIKVHNCVIDTLKETVDFLHSYNLSNIVIRGLDQLTNFESDYHNSLPNYTREELNISGVTFKDIPICVIPHHSKFITSITVREYQQCCDVCKARRLCCGTKYCTGEFKQL